MIQAQLHLGIQHRRTHTRCSPLTLRAPLPFFPAPTAPQTKDGNYTFASACTGVITPPTTFTSIKLIPNVKGRLVFSSSSCSGQTCIPLVNVPVQLWNAANSSVAATTTNTNGNYTLAISGAGAGAYLDPRDSYTVVYKPTAAIAHKVTDLPASGLNQCGGTPASGFFRDGDYVCNNDPCADIASNIIIG